MSGIRLIKRGDDEYERVVMCELLSPDVPNCYGDIYTREAIKDFVYAYAEHGFGLDIDHDLIDVNGEKLLLVESFIARPGDPDFAEGSWVIAMKVLDDETWQMVLDGKLNGFSYQADCFMTDVVIQNLRNRQVTGTTQPDLTDGHTHTYLVLLNALNQPISGGTGVTDGHSHRISIHTVTSVAISLFGAGEHNHRYQVLTH